MIRICSNCGQQNRVPAKHLAATGRCGACKAELGPVDEPIEADTELFDQVRLQARVPVLVDFWAPWCGPCRMAGPELKRLAKDMAARALVLKVNTDSFPDVAARYGVNGIPHFVLLKDGQSVFAQSGLASAAEMKRWLTGAGA